MIRFTLVVWVLQRPSLLFVSTGPSDSDAFETLRCLDRDPASIISPRIWSINPFALSASWTIYSCPSNKNDLKAAVMLTAFVQYSSGIKG